MSLALRGELETGCKALGIALDQHQLQQLLDYLSLLDKWNRSYNLTAVRDPRAMVTRHLLDSLAIAPWIEADLLIDVGTGGGLPGVPLSIAFPDKHFHLLDSNGKKTRFLFQVKTDLGLDNMTIHHARVEAFRTEQGFDAVLSRAFASLEDMVVGAGHLLAADGDFLAMKGIHPGAELASIEKLCEAPEIFPLDVPGLAEERHLVKMQLRQPVASQ